MSFSLRSFTARRYRLDGELPSGAPDAIARRLLGRAFTALSPNEERSYGWVTADNCLDTRFADAAIGRGPALVFALRVDKRRVSARMLRARMDLELRGRRRDAGEAGEGAPPGAARGDGPGAGAAPRGRPGEARRPSARASREEKADLRRQLTEELLQSTSPSMDVHTVLVYPRERFVLFGSLSKAANELFRTLFTETFDVSLSALTPFHRALELLEARGGSATLASLRRTDVGHGLEPSEGAFERARGADRATAGRPAVDRAAIDPRLAAGRELSPEVLS